MFDFAATLVRETDIAWLLDARTGAEIWFQKSDTKDNGDGTFTCPDWLAFEKEIV